MKPEDAPKTARMELRATEYQKSVIEMAASLVGESVTSYVLSKALDDAHRIIRENHVTELSLADWEQFSALLAEDAAPNEHLRNALRAYREQVAE